MDTDIQLFFSTCIDCAAVDGLHRIIRIYAHTLHALRPNTYIHFDFCYVEGIAEGEYQYILADKDDFIHFYGLCPAQTPLGLVFQMHWYAGSRATASVASRNETKKVIAKTI